MLPTKRLQKVNPNIQSTSDGLKKAKPQIDNNETGSSDEEKVSTNIY